MKQLVPKIREMANKIRESERKRKMFAEFLRKVNPKIELFHFIKPLGLNDLKIVGVDGGLAKRSLHGFDCVLVRSVGVCFEYKKNKIKTVRYYPSKLPPVKADVTEALNDLDWAYYTSVFRMFSEVETAIKCAEVFSPDIILMDGSIVPHYSDRPSKTSQVYSFYKELVEKYHKLYKVCKEREIILAGIIEDSRGNRFCDIIRKEVLSRIEHPSKSEAENILEKTRDTNLLFWVLKRGETTISFQYADNPDEHPVLREFNKDVREKIYSFYVKTAELDRPIRVDFMKNREAENKIAGILLSISGQHSGYGIPAPLIEADTIAKLSETEMEIFYSQVMRFAGNLPGLMRLRREQRPF